ncbi:MAG: hypothetical protein ACRCZI_12330 [Cetobacterium sp.]
MGHRVDLAFVYRHPKTHKRLPIKKALVYNKRAKKKIIPEKWLIARHTVGNTSGLSKTQIGLLKRRAGRIAYAARLTYQEIILPLKSFAQRKVRQTLANFRVFKKLWDDFVVPHDLQRRGVMRISLAGLVEGHRVRKVIHLPFLRTAWMESFSSEANAYEAFKDWLVGSILSHLRRARLRISNPKESARRISDLTKNRQGMMGMAELETNAAKIGGWMERVKWATKAIGEQKRTRQLTNATLRIEKLV